MSKIIEYKTTVNDSRIIPVLRNEDGIVLIAAMIFMMAFAALGLTIVYTSTANIHISSNTISSSQAFMGAEAGLAEAINNIRKDSKWGPDLNNDGSTSDDASAWAVASSGTIDLGNTETTYTTTIFDSTGSYGRENNSIRMNRYVALAPDDILLEVSASANGMTRNVSLVVRPSLDAFDYAIFTEGQIAATGTGGAPGTFTGKVYGNEGVNVAGNYDLSNADAESTTSISGGNWNSTDDAHEQVDAPLLDFAHYQEQNNFGTQQVFIMTPYIGSLLGDSRKLYYDMETLGTTYTITAYTKIVDDITTVYWCTDITWDADIDTNCPDGGAPQTYSYTDDSPSEEKPYINVHQFNAYTAPTDSAYTSSVVNIFDTLEHLEFYGPDAGETVPVTATILVGNSAINDSPSGRIDFYGNGGTIDFVPENGLAIVSGVVKFRALEEDGNLGVNIGSENSGAIVIASSEVKITSEGTSDLDFTLNGSLVVGGDDLEGDNDNDNNAVVEIEGLTNGTSINFNYVKTDSVPSGWLTDGSKSFERREWSEK